MTNTNFHCYKFFSYNTTNMILINITLKHDHIESFYQIQHIQSYNIFYNQCQSLKKTHLTIYYINTSFRQFHFDPSR
jgi:hypothetical protein